MDLTFLIGIVVIVLASSTITGYAITLHHCRRMNEIRIAEHASQAKFLIMDKAIDRGIHPGSYLDKF